MNQNEPGGRPNSPLLWGELSELCRRVHDVLYLRKHREAAVRWVEDLERILGELPSDSKAIVYWEASALVAELKGLWAEAAEHRRREIALILELHQLVKDGKDAPTVLAGRDRKCLEERQAILRDLLRKDELR